MKLTVLVDNSTLIDRYFLGEPALSFLLQDQDFKLLFDTGYSDAFLHNARSMDINILDIDYIVLSHGHIDHTGGLIPLTQQYLKARIEQIQVKTPILIAHTDVFKSRIINEIGDIGSPISQHKMAQHCQLNLRKKPYWITDRLIFLGEIPRLNDFECQDSFAKILNGDSIEDDNIIDDSSLVYRIDNGLIIIAGCAHSGICNTIAYARKICDNAPVLKVIGGFHMLDASQYQLDKTVEFLAQLNIMEIYACHCVDLAAKIALSQLNNLKQVGVGLRLDLN